MNTSDLTSYIHKHIPLTAQLGAIVKFYDGNSIEIYAPLEPNLNHRNTAFGGSLSALGILCGWALLFLKLRENGLKNRLVIQKSSFDFLSPIASEFKATCTMPDETKWKNFVNTLKRHGKARITLTSKIKSEEGNGGNHEGVYVAILIEK